MHQYMRTTSIILICSFIVSLPLAYLIYKHSIEGGNDWILIRFWFIACILPTWWFAYRKNPNRLHSPQSILTATERIRIRTKTSVLLLQTLSIFFVAYIISIIFKSRSHQIFVEDFSLFLPLIIIFIILYVCFSDSRLSRPEDEYARIGAMLFRHIPLQKDEIREFILKTMVKIFFIPYMYGGLMMNFSVMLNTSWQISPVSFSTLIFNIAVNLDMLIGAFGYLFSSSLIGNSIKDTDKNLCGWLFALICYPPLNWVLHNVNQQHDQLIWADIMPAYHWSYWLFFILINTLWIIYFLATFEFGISFSNLSWRFLVYRGVYRYCKHPAYVAKNLYWWLHTLPFCGVAWLGVTWWQNVLGLTFVSLIYYGRAWSEERHLSKFREYRVYQRYIARYGIFRFIHLPGIA